MTENITNTAVKPKQRLMFIDLARSVAILLMLEGHFVDDSLMEIYRDLDNPVYATWLFIRGFTAPVFLTVTGIVFVYLLLNSRAESFRSNIRIRKGYKRVVELIFWGFVLQYYAFHVLQCIGVGIFVILGLYGLYKAIKRIPLWIYFATMGFLVFNLNTFLGTLGPEEYWPTHAPTFIQNMFHGPYSIFAIIPWMGFTMFGAMIGCLLHDFSNYVQGWGFRIVFFLIGAILFFFSKDLFIGFDQLYHQAFPNSSFHLSKIDWLYTRLGMVMMELGTLMFVEKLMGTIKNGLFLKVGQNTLTIYTLHMVILYGSITGIGLNDWFEHRLNPWEVTIGAALFLTFFITLIHYLDWIKAKLSFILVPSSKIMSGLFGIKK